MEILEFIVNHTVIPSAICAVAYFIFKERFKKLVHKQAEKEIESYKSELAITVNTISHKLKMDYAKFEMGLSNRFEIYPNIFERFLKAEGMISRLYGFSRSLDLNSLNDQAFIEYVNSSNILGGDKSDIISKVSSNRDIANKTYEKAARNLQFNQAYNALVDAKNYFFLRELFVSDPVQSEVSNCISKLSSMWGAFETCFKTNGSHSIDIVNLQKDASTALKNLKNVLQNELK